MLSRKFWAATARLPSRIARPIYSIPAIEPLWTRTFTTSPFRANPDLQAQTDSLQPPEVQNLTINSEPSEVAASEHEAPQLPYFVARNNLQNLGVYQLTKRGGNMKVTLLKHIEGDVNALKEDIRVALELPLGAVIYNSTTKHLHIKGFERQRLLLFLKTMGF
ncbi:mitochondrial large subunit ribosomal protein-domain-containing protein [Xylariaceae sp. FL0255]|nr:mitochondrial large subunit ribosomal protein-domain-containing protein [Xylariaceae sp. FL0255]